MKTPVLAVLLIAGFSQMVPAQNQNDSKEGKSARTRAGISAGPAVTQFFSKAYKPALSYSAGLFSVTKFRRFDVQLGAQYLPIGTTFKSWNGYAEFMNHVVNFSAQMKLHFRRVENLTFDVGASVAKGLSYTHSDTPQPPLVCLVGIYGDPVPVTTQSFLLTGASWALPRNNSVSMTALTTLVVAEFMDTGLVNPGYWVVQATFSHAF